MPYSYPEPLISFGREVLPSCARRRFYFVCSADLFCLQRADLFYWQCSNSFCLQCGNLLCLQRADLFCLQRADLFCLQCGNLLCLQRADLFCLQHADLFCLQYSMLPSFRTGPVFVQKELYLIISVGHLNLRQSKNSKSKRNISAINCRFCRAFCRISRSVRTISFEVSISLAANICTFHCTVKVL